MKKLIIAAVLLTSCATSKTNLDHSGWVIENRIEQKTKPGEQIMYRYYLEPTNGLSRATTFESPIYFEVKHLIPFK